MLLDLDIGYLVFPPLGMYQRLEKLNKNAFANMCVFGKSRDAQIQGLWVWRGKELVFPICDNWQVRQSSIVTSLLFTYGNMVEMAKHGKVGSTIKRGKVQYQA